MVTADRVLTGNDRVSSAENYKWLPHTRHSLLGDYKMATTLKTLIDGGL